MSVRKGACFTELHRAGEDYLKTILLLQNKNGSVRSLDVARKLNVSRPSVSAAMKLLRDGGFLTMDHNKRISLTDAGREAAELIYEKNTIVKECLISLGVDPDIAEKDACIMEHLISRETLEQMKRFTGKEAFA